MSRSERGALLLLALLVAALGFGVWRLFALRFTAGDFFPAYSSLRADPLGTKILFESLGRAGVDAERGFRPLSLSRAGELAGVTVFMVGAERDEFELVAERLARDLEATAANGSRLVIAFHPEREPPEAPRPTVAPQAAAAEKAGARRSQATKTGPEPVSLPGRWGFRFAFAALPAAGAAPAAARPEAAGGEEDAALWHSTLVFADLDASWRVLGTRRGRPVLIERDYGPGSIVLLADSYPLSNEALLRDRRPRLLSGLLGANRRALFDEAHLGLRREPGGIVSLLGRFRLGGLALGLAVLGLLALWRGASPFLPPWPQPAEGDGESAGRGSTAALVDLVRRNIRAAELPLVCLQEWVRTFPERRRGHPERYARALALAERARDEKTEDAAGVCRRIASILKGA